MNFSKRITLFQFIIKYSKSVDWKVQIFERNISKYNQVMFLSKTKPFHLNWETVIHFEVRGQTMKYGTKTLYLAPKISSSLSETTKNLESLEWFKLKIRKWKPEYPCSLYKTYLKHVGFVWPCSFLVTFLLFSFS